MGAEGGEKSRGEASGDQSSPPPPPPPPPPNYYYGTFQGVANYPPQPPLPHQSHSVIGIPQPVPPAGAHPHYHPHGCQAVPGYVVAEERHFREERLPCCGVGIGWLLFIAGFFLGAIPWYIGAFLLLVAHLDYREKPGLIACTIAALLAVLAVSLGVTRATLDW